MSVVVLASVGLGVSGRHGHRATGTGAPRSCPRVGTLSRLRDVLEGRGQDHKRQGTLRHVHLVREVPETGVVQHGQTTDTRLVSSPVPVGTVVGGGLPGTGSGSGWNWRCRAAGPTPISNFTC